MDSSVQAVNAQCARAHSAPLYPLQFAADVARLRNECTGDDLNIEKPTVKDNLKSSITNSYNRGDTKEVKR